ncbi:MAG: DUF4012 domain-containing protein [bacterium]
MSSLILLFSEPNCLAISLVENLLANRCHIKVFSKNNKQWIEKSKHIQTKENLEYLTTKDIKEMEGGNYAIFLNIEDEINPKLINEAVTYSLKEKIKTFIIIPFRKYPETNLANINLPDTVGLVFVGDLIGPRMDLFENNPISVAMASLLKNKKLDINTDNIVYPVFIGDVARLVTKWLFSFGPYGDITAVLSEDVGITEVVNNIDNILNKEHRSLFNKHPKDLSAETERLLVPKGIKRINIKSDLINILTATVEWFQKNKPGKINYKYHKHLRVWVLLFMMLTAIFIFPIIILITSILSLQKVKQIIDKGNLAEARQLVDVSAKTSVLAESLLVTYSRIPLLGKVYSQPVYVARLVSNISLIGVESINLLEDVSVIVNNMFAGKDYDVYGYSDKMSVNLMSVYEKLSFLEGEIGSAGGYWERLFSNKLKSYGMNDIEEKKNLIKLAAVFADKLPATLGAEKKKIYLVLLQNNMELRPTGGFIGSFALVTLEAGKISDITIQDVYSADGQLKGYVKPPAPIANYLGNANWFLRDSNWDPDFPTSAQRAEWFLDKEIDVSVDGVISIDLEPIRDLMGVYGPISLADYGVTLDELNFYEKTQAEAERDFFPGSYRKSGFLTAIAKALTAEFAVPNKGNFLNISKMFFENIKQKHIQIFLHDRDVQRIVSDLGWDGSVSHPDCSGNCFSDWFGLVEANFGVNKSNYYIKRNYSLQVSLQPDGLVKKILNVSYSNIANAAMGPSANYKTYTRLLLSPDAEIINLSLVNGKSEEELKYDTELVRGRKEIGTLMEIPPDGNRTLNMEWRDKSNLNFGEPGQYQLLWRKQSGLGDEPFWIKYEFSQVGEYKVETIPPLTFGGQSGYNALLSRDVVSRIFW